MRNTRRRLESLTESALLREIADNQHGQPGSQARDFAETILRAKRIEREMQAQQDLLLSNQAQEAHLRKQHRWQVAATIISAVTALAAAVIGALLAR
jgi:hypothetical protein